VARVALRDRFREHPVWGFGGWVLRGIAQVVFQNNPITGALILAGIFYNSWIYGLACLFGTIISTATAVLFKADKGLIKDGLFGFNGALVAVALVAYTSPNSPPGTCPTSISGCTLCSARSSHR
jgi:urea transporter